MIKVRPTAVAGRFYHSDAATLRAELDGWLEPLPADPSIRAIVVPHAGYQFSGKVAAQAYRYIRALGERVRRVILVGPAHTMAFDGLALPSADLFVTPLGNVEIDKSLVAKLRDEPKVTVYDLPHAKEHCLEVQLPFLQQALGQFSLLPLLYSRVTPWYLEEMMAKVWDPADTLLVISSDLSHYHEYDEACGLDARSMAMIEEGVPRLTPQQACGATGINALLHLAQHRGWQFERLDYQNSGDTGGNKQRVVGYVSYVVREVQPV
ncbi:AmmeMemoRadiSam system protein B [Shewanella sp. GXUN23E]|uniref:AmmeMemoRadiSam system protein B n=1 Tax=Shewanella sp. GXUN23E TaxID=3422498 RepID=UPI003D7C861E